eukprot:6260557-Amphidinium_carterae.1
MNSKMIEDRASDLDNTHGSTLQGVHARTKYGGEKSSEVRLSSLQCHKLVWMRAVVALERYLGLEPITT